MHMQHIGFCIKTTRYYYGLSIFFLLKISIQYFIVPKAFHGTNETRDF